MPTNRYVNKRIMVIHAMEHYSATDSNELLIRATVCFSHVLLSVVKPGMITRCFLVQFLLPLFYINNHQSTSLSAPGPRAV